MYTCARVRIHRNELMNLCCRVYIPTYTVVAVSILALKFKPDQNWSSIITAMLVILRPATHTLKENRSNAWTEFTRLTGASSTVHDEDRVVEFVRALLAHQPRLGEEAGVSSNDICPEYSADQLNFLKGVGSLLSAPVIPFPFKRHARLVECLMSLFHWTMLVISDIALYGRDALSGRVTISLPLRQASQAALSLPCTMSMYDALVVCTLCQDAVEIERVANILPAQPVGRISPLTILLGNSVLVPTR
jgi:hypothetical protein